MLNIRGFSPLISSDDSLSHWFTPARHGSAYMKYSLSGTSSCHIRVSVLISVHHRPVQTQCKITRKISSSAKCTRNKQNKDLSQPPKPCSQRQALPFLCQEQIHKHHATVSIPAWGTWAFHMMGRFEVHQCPGATIKAYSIIN